MSWQDRLTSQNLVPRAPLDMSGGGSGASNRPAAGRAKKDDQSQPKAGGAAALGIYTDTVDKRGPSKPLAAISSEASNPDRGSGRDQSKSENPEETKKKTTAARRAIRHRLHREQRAAAKLIRLHIRHDHRVTKCKWMKAAGSVELIVNTYGEGADQVRRASYRGLVICGNVWACPVCGSRISRIRRDEMNKLLAWAREQKLVPVLLTLTARHGLEDRLADLLDGMKEAKRRLRQRAEWRALPFRGSVTATEITHGTRSGWHPHFHEIVLLEAEDEAEALAMVAPLADAWRVSLAAFGLDGAAAAFDARGAASAGDYVAKWGVAEEMTLANAKRGEKAERHRRGRLPAELAQMGANGDVWAEALWVEFFEATSGKRRRQLVWSPGLKDACGLTEITDEEAAAKEAEDEDDVEVAAVWGSEWRDVQAKRCNLMDAAEDGGAAAVAVAVDGPDDDQDDRVIEHGSAPLWMWPKLIAAQKELKERAPADIGPDERRRRLLAAVKALDDDEISQAQAAVIAAAKPPLSGAQGVGGLPRPAMAGDGG